MLSPNDTNENTDGHGEAPEVNSLNSSDLSEQLNYLHSYPFVSDLEFKTGLAVILGHPGTAASDAEVLQQDDLILQAKCFYISRKKNINPPLDPVHYKTWLQSRADSPQRTEPRGPDQNSEVNDSLGPQWVANSQDDITSPSSQSVSGVSQGKDEPAYPSSFAHIVELITTGQPIPGIEQIPETVLVGHEEPSKISRRSKPWERDTEQVEAQESK